MELTLGPLQFNWPSDKLERFYAEIADHAPIERVYLGEIVCSKRLPLIEAALVRAAERLVRAGKTVVWSSLVLPATRREQNLMRELASSEDEVEINDMSALLERQGRSFTAGPFLNVYNEAALAEIVALGCTRIVPNIELSLEAVQKLHLGAPGLPIELFAFGRLPLAISGRCYHARIEGLHKDSCQFVCENDADGRIVRTVEGTPFLAVNGVQTLSDGVQVAGLHVEKLHAAGISALRLSPHDVDMVAVACAFDSFVHSKIGVPELHERLNALGLPGPIVDGYLRAAPGCSQPLSGRAQLFAESSRYG